MTHGARRQLPFAATIVGVGMLFVVPGSAWAYLDPAAGSIAFQAAVGAVLAGLAAARMYWSKVRSLLRSRRDSDSAEPHVHEDRTS